MATATMVGITGPTMDSGHPILNSSVINPVRNAADTLKNRAAVAADAANHVTKRQSTPSLSR